MAYDLKLKKELWRYEHKLGTTIYCCGPNIFFFNDTATTEIYTLSLHDALPIPRGASTRCYPRARAPSRPAPRAARWSAAARDRKSTRLNSSHANISYAVFCLKKKKMINLITEHKQEDPQH